jgi:N-carbamoyl-L-amino-acid hydrolase
MHASPGVITAVAGSTEMQLDQRHLDRNELAAMFAEAQQACASAGEEFNCTLERRDVFRAAPTPFDRALVELARASVQEAGGDASEPIPSGPLHDATEIGRVVPTAMIFAQSDPPISHASIEDSPERALTVAIDAYGRTVSSVLARVNETTSKGAM